MSHWMSHVGPSDRDKLMANPRWRECSWWNLPEPELMAVIERENQDYEDHYPCDDSCHDWLDELCAMACRYEEIAPGKAPWLK